MKRRYFLICTVIISAVLLAFCGRIIERWLSQSDEVRQMKLGSMVYQLEIADSILEQRRGLMNREQLLQDHGMYFVFTDSAERSFWMKNTLIPLDLIWVNQGVVVGITPDARPEPGVSDLELQLYRSPGPADAVIELNAGEVAHSGLKIGDRIQFDSAQ